MRTNVIPLVAASEEGLAQTYDYVRKNVAMGVVRQNIYNWLQIALLVEIAGKRCHRE